MIGYGEDGAPNFRGLFDGCLCVRFAINCVALPVKLRATTIGINLQCATVKFSTARQFKRLSNGIVFGSSELSVENEIGHLSKIIWRLWKEMPTERRFLGIIMLKMPTRKEVC